MIATIVAAALAVGSAVYGGIKSSQAAKKAEREQQRQEAKEEAWYKRRYNENYADTAAGQSLITQAKDYARQMNKKAEGAQAVTGGSDAATAMAKDSGNRMVGNTLASLAAQDTARKDNVDNAYLQMQKANSQIKQKSYLTKAANISQAASQSSNTFMNLAGGLENANSSSGIGSSSSNGTISGANNTGNDSLKQYQNLFGKQRGYSFWLNSQGYGAA